MRSQAEKTLLGPTIKVQYRNMLEKTRSQHTNYTVSAKDIMAKDIAAYPSMAGNFPTFCVIMCNEANLHNPESYYSEYSQFEGWCCISTTD